MCFGNVMDPLLRGVEWDIYILLTRVYGFEYGVTELCDDEMHNLFSSLVI